MNRAWFGDSYDIVKRFFVGVLNELGYTVYVDPMPTGEWADCEPAFCRFVGAQIAPAGAARSAKSALLIDPDTGIHDRKSKQHVTIASFVERLESHDVVFVFDQSFARAADQSPQMHRKLEQLGTLDAHGFYYDSHARFLFCARSMTVLDSVVSALLATGLPEGRIVRPARR